MQTSGSIRRAVCLNLASAAVSGPRAVLRQTLTKTERSRISRANCPRSPGLSGRGSLGAENGPLRAQNRGFTSFLGELPGQRRTDP